MESSETKVRTKRRDMVSTHAWLLAVQEYALAHGKHVQDGVVSTEPGSDPIVDDAMAQVIGQLRSGYRKYAGGWKFRGWTGEESPYGLLAAMVPREYRWSSPDGTVERIVKRGEISHKKVLLAAAECAEPWTRTPLCSGPLSEVATLRHPSFLTHEQARKVYDFHLLPKQTE